MKKIDLTQASQIPANMGVVAGIVYLAVETNQNTKSLDITAYQDLTGQVLDVSQFMVEDPRRFELAFTGSKSMGEMDAEERNIASQMILQVFSLGDMVYYQYQQGIVPEERLDTSLIMLRAGICNPNPQSLWRDVSENYSAAFQGYVNDLIQSCE